MGTSCMVVRHGAMCGRPKDAGAAICAECQVRFDAERATVAMEQTGATCALLRRALMLAALDVAGKDKDHGVGLVISWVMRASDELERART